MLSLAVTASTGKAANNMNGTTLHSAFQVKQVDAGFREWPSDDPLSMLQKRYQYLKDVLI